MYYTNRYKPRYFACVGKQKTLKLIYFNENQRLIRGGEGSLTTYILNREMAFSGVCH